MNSCTALALLVLLLLLQQEKKESILQQLFRYDDEVLGLHFVLDNDRLVKYFLANDIDHFHV